MPDAFDSGKVPVSRKQLHRSWMPTLHRYLLMLSSQSLEESPFPMQDTLYALGNNIELWMTYLVLKNSPWLRREQVIIWSDGASN